MNELIKIEREIVISSNEDYTYFAEFLKRVVSAIKDAEKIKDAIKAKLAEYRQAQEASRLKEEASILRKALSLGQPAVVTKMIPKVEGVHSRKTLKWRVKNEKLVPREYLTTDDKKISGIVKALGKAAGIRGIEVYEDEVIVAMSGR